jgi:uncharacterized membrane protein YcfT
MSSSFKGLSLHLTWERVLGFLFCSLYSNFVITLNILSQRVYAGSILSQWAEQDQLVFKVVMGLSLFLICEIASFTMFIVEE